MNLPEFLATNPSGAELAAHAVVLTLELRDILESVQGGDQQRMFRVGPVPLVEGRFMLCADLLGETGEGGLYVEGFSQLPVEALQLVEILPMADAVALRPDWVI